MTPGLRRAIRAARRGVGWAAPDRAWGVDLERPGAAPVSVHRRHPGDDPLVRLLADGDLEGARLSLTEPPAGAAWAELAAAPLAGIDVGLVAPPLDRGPPIRSGLAVEPVVRLNRGPLHRQATGRPLMLLKAAASLDGRSASRDGVSQWITGPRARAWGRTLRAEADAIVVGIQTVLTDDPLLTSRWAGARDPVRVVLDSTLRMPLTARLVQTAGSVPTRVLTTPAAVATARAAALRAAGVQVDAVSAGADGRPDPGAAVERFAAWGWTTVLVEGGPTVAGSFVDAGRVDYVCWFVAPLVLGGEGARAAVGGRGAERPSTALRLEGVRRRKLGPDLLIEGWVAGRRPAAPGPDAGPDIEDEAGG